MEVWGYIYIYIYMYIYNYIYTWRCGPVGQLAEGYQGFSSCNT